MSVVDEIPLVNLVMDFLYNSNGANTARPILKAGTMHHRDRKWPNEHDFFSSIIKIKLKTLYRKNFPNKIGWEKNTTKQLFNLHTRQFMLQDFKNNLPIFDSYNTNEKLQLLYFLHIENFMINFNIMIL